MSRQADSRHCDMVYVLISERGGADQRAVKTFTIAGKSCEVAQKSHGPGDTEY